jgi:hypothetical protein
MHKIKSLFVVFLLPILIKSQSFGGAIEFKYFTTKDTTTNTYLVKENNVKLDQYSKKSQSVEGSFVFDLGAKSIKFVNPKRKVWGEHDSQTPPVIKGTCAITKGSKSKTILGVKCSEYIVKNTDENTEITYWIATGKYDFFIPLVKLWNRKDKQSIYFNQIKDLPAGSMPLLSEEKQISDGKILSRLEVVKLTKEVIEDAKLTVPADYKKFEQ